MYFGTFYRGVPGNVTIFEIVGRTIASVAFLKKNSLGKKKKENENYPPDSLYVLLDFTFSFVTR